VWKCNGNFFSPKLVILVMIFKSSTLLVVPLEGTVSQRVEAEGSTPSSAAAPLSAAAAAAAVQTCGRETVPHQRSLLRLLLSPHTRR